MAAGIFPNIWIYRKWNILNRPGLLGEFYMVAGFSVTFRVTGYRMF